MGAARPISETVIIRAIRAAQKEGGIVVVKPDGTLTIEPKETKPINPADLVVP